MEFSWRPGIGDPTFAGWLTVVLYFLVALYCLRLSTAFRRQHFRASEGAGFWTFFAIAFGLLGLNKQLDLQSALTELGRVTFYSLGWYEDRQLFQLVFVLAVVAAAIIGFAWLMLRARKIPGCGKLVLLGSEMLLVFIVLRASSFHHMDRFIGAEWLGMRWNWILEIGGISVVLAGCSCRTSAVLRSGRPARRRY